MASPDRINELIHNYLNGVITNSESTELAELLASDPTAADAFAHAARLDSLLETHFTERRQAAEWQQDAINTTSRKSHSRVRRVLAVAGIAAAVLVAFVLQSRRTETIEVAQNRCTSGRVLVNGIEATTIPDGAQVTVVGASSAAIRLKDGGEMELAPSSSAVIGADDAGSVVDLDYGQAKFRALNANTPLRVSTPVGAVSGRAAQFAVESQATESPGVSAMGSNVLALLTVVVLAGQVEVQQQNEKTKVSAGESRAFTAEKEKKPMFAGRVVSISADGTRITLEGKPPKPGLPPQQREVLIAAGTQRSYFGVPKDGDHPTVGYTATAFLDPASPETALAIEFGSKAASFVGGVKEVAADGSSMTISVYRKNDTPEERSIKLTQDTRISYVGVDASGEKPTVGYQALVWLASASDEATEVRFVSKNKRPPASTDQPQPSPKKKSPEKKPDEPGKEKPRTKTPVEKNSGEGNKENPKLGKPAEKKPTEKEPGEKKPAVDKSKLPDSKNLKPETSKPTKGETTQTAQPKELFVASAAGISKPGPAPMTRRTSTRDARSVAQAIDTEIDQRLNAAKIPSSPPADDAEFLRRAYLDITGTIPSAAAVARFLDSTDADKRAHLIDDLLADPAYGRRFAAVWKRLISPKPANNGKPQVDRFTPWLAEKFNQNKGWNEIVQELLTTDVNITREPNGFFLQVNSEAQDPRPNLLAAGTGRLFLGVQLGCAECHNHPFASWKQTEFWSLAAFFSRLHKRSKSDLSLVEDPLDATMPVVIKIPTGGQSGGSTVPARFLGNVEPQFTNGTESRRTLADWITSRDNPYFARATVNRLWAHFFSRGLVDPLDGFQEGYTASHPEALDRLSAEFIASEFDLQHIIRVICNTSSYGRTSRPRDDNAQDAQLLSHMAVKALSADVLYDALTTATGNTGMMVDSGTKGGKSQGLLPRDEFISFFAGPAADSSSHQYALGIPQLLRLMNADAYNVGSPLAKSLAASDAAPDERITSLYLSVLSRRPTENERQLLVSFVTDRQHTEQAYSGALWMLLNSSEFVLNR